MFFRKPRHLRNVQDLELQWAGEHVLTIDKAPLEVTLEDLITVADMVKEHGTVGIVFRFPPQQWFRFGNQVAREHMFERTMAACLKSLDCEARVWISDGPGWGPPGDREYVRVQMENYVPTRAAC